MAYFSYGKSYRRLPPHSPPSCGQQEGDFSPTRKAGDTERPATSMATLPFMKAFDIILTGTSAFCMERLA